MKRLVMILNVIVIAFLLCFCLCGCEGEEEVEKLNSINKKCLSDLETNISLLESNINLDADLSKPLKEAKEINEKLQNNPNVSGDFDFKNQGNNLIKEIHGKVLMIQLIRNSQKAPDKANNPNNQESRFSKQNIPANSKKVSEDLKTVYIPAPGAGYKPFQPEP